MKKKLFILFILVTLYLPGLKSQPASDTTVYLLTCGPGTDTYSIYGHSALRIVIPESKSDIVYNWGVFDFETPNFAWKFAKGRLDYMLSADAPQRFLQSYFHEERYVYSQVINLNSEEKRKLVSLIIENLKPENRKYRYDFFYDDCSTKIRDLLEEAVGKNLLYPPVEIKDVPTFREMVGKYQDPFPWLNFGIDLIMGSPGDKEASFRDRMFLPIDLKDALSEAVVKRDGKMIPLVQNPELILDFAPLLVRQSLVTSPSFVFMALLTIVILLSAYMRGQKINKIIDIILFLSFSILAILMIFFNFFTDHSQMKWNLNIIWLSPFIILCLATLLLNTSGALWFRIVFYISAAFLLLNIFLPQDFNIAIYPLVLILLIRSSLRAGFEWNPFSLE
jgi:heme/copper-type cytochrome/quinol oxidase subunit 4